MGRASVPRLLQARVPASLALLLAVVAAGVLLRPAAASTLQQLGAANLTLLRPLSAGQYAMIEFYASCEYAGPGRGARRPGMLLCAHTHYWVTPVKGLKTLHCSACVCDASLQVAGCTVLLRHAPPPSRASTPRPVPLLRRRVPRLQALCANLPETGSLCGGADL